MTLLTEIWCFIAITIQREVWFNNTKKSNILVKLYKMYEILFMRKIYEIIHLTNNSYK